MNITFPTNTASIINKIRGVIGRDITIYVTVSGTPCPTCTLDPVTNLSTDPYCVTCLGNYWLNTLSGWTCSGHVRWYKADQPLWTNGGIVDIGDCKVTIAHSGAALQHVQNSHHFLVDDVELYMKNYRLKGVKATNRIMITLLESPNI